MHFSAYIKFFHKSIIFILLRTTIFYMKIERFPLKFIIHSTSPPNNKYPLVTNLILKGSFFSILKGNLKGFTEIRILYNHNLFHLYLYNTKYKHNLNLLKSWERNVLYFWINCYDFAVYLWSYNLCVPYILHPSTSSSLLLTLFITIFALYGTIKDFFMNIYMYNFYKL